jgi:hypothetical protein
MMCPCVSRDAFTCVYGGWSHRQTCSYIACDSPCGLATCMRVGRSIIAVCMHFELRYKTTVVRTPSRHYCNHQLASVQDRTCICNAWYTSSINTRTCVDDREMLLPLLDVRTCNHQVLYSSVYQEASPNRQTPTLHL